jgi:phosphohistidine phosphatase
MKTLYFLRHGKSSWEEPNLLDYDRPLLKKGKKRTKRIAKHLKSIGQIPMLIICSPALRARETAEIAAKILGSKLIFDDKLYPGNMQSIMEVIYAQDNTLDSIMLVGHNPAFTSLVREMLQADLEWLPTSGVGYGQWNIKQWEDIPLQHPEEVYIIVPKQLKKNEPQQD